MASASQKWWNDSRFDHNRDLVLVAIVLVAFFFGSAIDFIMFGSEGLFPRPLVTLRNYVFVGLLALSYLAFRRGKWRSFAIVALLSLCALSLSYAFYVQNVIVYLTLVGFLVAAMPRFPFDRLFLGAFIFVLAAATIVGIYNPLPAFEIDPNTGWRLAWWRDGLEASAQTWGIGVGFGTESLRNEYSALLGRDTYWAETEEFLFISTHSAFFDTIFRTGFIGFLLLCVVLVRCLPHPQIEPLARAHCCAMFAVLLLCLHSNLGLQSPMYSLGVAFCIGYLQSERRKARVGSPAAVGVPAGLTPYAIPVRQG